MTTRTYSAAVVANQAAPSVITLPSRSSAKQVQQPTVDLTNLAKLAQRIEILSSASSYDEAVPASRLEKIHDLTLLLLEHIQNESG